MDAEREAEEARRCFCMRMGSTSGRPARRAKSARTMKNRNERGERWVGCQCYERGRERDALSTTETTPRSCGPVEAPFVPLRGDGVEKSWGGVEAMGEYSSGLRGSSVMKTRWEFAGLRGQYRGKLRYW